MRFTVIGNFTIDIIGGKRRPGGGAYYSSLVLSKFADVRVLTKVGMDYPREWLKEVEEYVELIPIEGKSSVVYELIYRGEERVIRVISKGDPFKDHELQEAQGKVIINPVANEITPEQVSLFKKPSLDVQGFVRELKEYVSLREIDGWFLSNCKIVHASLEEYQKIINPGMPEILVITNGGNEGVLIANETIRFRPKKITVRDPTGAGDTFLALLAYGIERFSIEEGLKFALEETAKFLNLGLKEYLNRDDEASIG
ncbi:PfkB family carbohydrate kinase [Pyrococcus kukulkanii]|uniref:PfkB family carbohydrate kinase n=1 Tax=Pyrococcus kukulkanii TaxID=1609559 RepID=A0A127BCR6_9EURY|nr:PfkB family carbohydrate kinase [Pyrococcus kukulkanii]AMM54599.1 hypothetical protein TQ32_08975 [Pyrococcus kukulkanii]